MSNSRRLRSALVQSALAAACVLAVLSATRADAQCGNGVVNGGEQCDAGSGVNGTVASCCSATCQFKLVGTACRAPNNTCELNALCTGASANCPANPFKPNGSSCSDGEFCNGTDTCQAGVCTHAGNPCGGGVCSEGFNACYANGCPLGPASGCRPALKSLLLIKNKEPDDGKDKLIWKWISGASVSQSQLSDPRSDANYALCIYSTSLVGAIDIPPNATAWAVSGTKGYKYGDDSLSEEGAKKAVLKGSDDAKSKALLKGAGGNLPDPIDVAGLILPVKVQFINHRNGICLESNFDTAASNSSALFKAKTP